MINYNKAIPRSDECAEPITVYTVTNGAESEKATVPLDEISYLKIAVPRRSAILQMYASFYNENGYITTLCPSFFKTLGGMDVYTIPLDVVYYKSDIYYIKFDCNTAYGKKYFSFNGNKGYFAKNEGQMYQLLVYERKYQFPEWFTEGIIYHIFVDRFYKSENKSTEKRDDAVYYTEWENGIPEYPEYVGGFLRNNTFFGGSIWGIIEKLDYIESLGTKTIYLSPIFKAFSNHKYDTGDYLQVDEGFGGDEALSELLSQCDKRGIKVILDGVFNHVGEDSIYFNKFSKYPSLGAFESKKSKYYPWFDFYKFPDDYDSWWGIKNLPKVKKIPTFKNFICKDVIKKYMKMGISGWRLDVADELDGTFLKQITASAKEEKKDAVVIGEVWEDASCKSAYSEVKHYFDDDRLDGVTNYPYRNGIINFIKTKNSATLKGILRTITTHYPSDKLNCLMNVLGTHDTERILTVLGGEESYGFPNRILATKKLSPERKNEALKSLMHAFMILYSLPGVPCIYYGDEAGMEGYHDPFNRRPYSWSNQNKELIEFVSTLSKIRNNHMALKLGDFTLFDSYDNMIAFERKYEDERIILIANYSENKLEFNIKNEYLNLLNDEKITGRVTIEKESIVMFKQIAPKK